MFLGPFFLLYLCIASGWTLSCIFFYNLFLLSVFFVYVGVLKASIQSRGSKDNKVHFPALSFIYVILTLGTGLWFKHLS